MLLSQYGCGYGCMWMRRKEEKYQKRDNVVLYELGSDAKIRRVYDVLKQIRLIEVNGRGGPGEPTVMRESVPQNLIR